MYRRHSWEFAGVGAAAWGLGYAALWLAGFPDDGVVSTLAEWCFGGGVVPIIVGLGALGYSLRMSRSMRRFPWQTVPVRHVLFSWGGAPAFALGPDGEHVLFLVAIRTRWDAFYGLDHVLFSGDLDRRGVVRTPGGSLVWVRRPRGAWCRRHLQRRVSRLNADAAPSTV